MWPIFNLTKSNSRTHAIAVMDRIDSWIEGGRIEGQSKIGGRLAANMEICTKAVICNGRNHMDGIKNQKKDSIVETVDWVFSREQENHE